MSSVTTPHPKGTRARILLASVFGPYALDDAFGSRTANPMELYQNQVTRVQGGFSLRMFHRSFALLMLQANIEAPCTVLDFASRERFVRELQDNAYDVVGIGAIIPNLEKVKEMCRLIRRYQPGAAIVVGGHIANYRDLAKVVDTDHIVRGDGIAWFRRYLGQSLKAPVKHPAVPSAFGTRILGMTLPDGPGDTAAILIPSVGCPVGCNFCSTAALFGGKGHFINFNGTAGIWRKECILDAGNWEGDTLTEDLDLSYRAQLKNWKFKYLEDVETPAELPVVISAARSQQFRWNKGGAENFRKTVLSVIKARNIPLKTKFHGVMHLLNSSMFLCVFLVAILSIPMLYIKNTFGHLGWIFEVTSFFIVSTIILFICYWFTYKSIQGSGLDNFVDYIKLFFTFFSVALGFSLHNTVAVLEGHMGKRSEFVRTPKFNIQNLKDSWKGNKYLVTKLSPNTILEFALMLYFLFGMYSAIPLNDFGLFPFHLMLFVGFGFVFFKSVTAKA